MDIWKFAAIINCIIALFCAFACFFAWTSGFEAGNKRGARTRQQSPDLDVEFLRSREWAERAGQQEARAEVAEARVRELEVVMNEMRQHVERDGCACTHTKEWIARVS